MSGPASELRSSPALRVVRIALPFAVSAGLLAWVLSGMDVGAIFANLTPSVAVVFVPALVVFLAVTLAIEAVCLTMVVSRSHPFDDVWVAARIKAASYPLGLVNYALGAAGSAVLLRRRAGITLAEAAGAVFAIGLFDLVCLIGFVLVGVGLMGSTAPVLRAGVVAGVAAALAAGFGLLRVPIPLGPLDRIRDLDVLRDARTLPLGLLARLAVLRLTFVGCFIGLAGATFAAFDVHVPTLDLVVDASVVLLVSALPIAVAGLGTGQVVFVAVFSRFAPPETLLAISLTLSFGLIVSRAAIGLALAHEFTAEALAAQHEEER